MKVGILIWDLNISGGTQRQALELACHLQDDAGLEVVVYTYFFDPDVCYPDLCAKLDIRYICRRNIDVNKGKVGELLRTASKYARFYFEIAQKQLLRILDDDIDLLNVHDYHVYPTAGLWKIETAKPVVWMMNDMPMYRLNTKNVLKTILFHIKPGFRSYIKSFDEIVVLDKRNQAEVQRNFDRSAKVVRSGIDIEKFPFHRRAQQRETIQLFSSGIFLPHRRIEDTIGAMRELLQKGYSVTLDHVGSDALGVGYAKRIYSMVKNSGFRDKVIFHQRVTDEKLLQLFQDADIFVFPNAPQTWGLAVFEAMASGLPVIVTTECGASEVLHDEVDAMIVDAQNPAALASAIERLHNDCELRDNIIEEAREFVVKNISWKLYADAMLHIFKSCNQLNNTDSYG